MLRVLTMRSRTQDKWTPAQVDRMKAGGNGKCREFFEANGTSWKNTPIPEKVRFRLLSQ